MNKPLSTILAGLGLFSVCLAAAATEPRGLATPVPASAKLRRLGPMPPGERLQLAIGLPWRNQPELTKLIQQIYNPASLSFHHYLTPAEFTERFGPTEHDYQILKDTAKSHRLETVSGFANRAVLDVEGSVADIEKMFHVHLSLYQHPTERRQFFAPDVEPTVDAGLPICSVVGLNNFILPQTHVHTNAIPPVGGSGNVLTGTGSNGWYLGADFRNGYANGVSGKGAGQTVGLYEQVGFVQADISEYESLAGLPNVPVQPVIMPGRNGLPDSSFNHDGEIALDIEMVIAMAPSLDNVIVVEAYTGLDGMNQLCFPSNGVAIANQVSSSWGTSDDAAYVPQLIEMQAQGQSFFLASGDNGAPTNGIVTSDQDYNDATLVGGSELYLTKSGGSWSNETVWDKQYIQGESTGAIMTDLSIPYYQLGVNTVRNGGSSKYRNVPDVAMCADIIEIVYTQGYTNKPQQSGLITVVGGTSAAAPLWAAFTALANEQAASQGKPNVGFLNPSLYSMAQSANYTSYFHDITSGNNSNSYSANLFVAGPGYDNCTGLGTPNGINFINALLGLSGPVFVNFNYTGSPQNGLFYTPYETLAQGIANVGNGATIFIETAGSSPSAVTITKPMTIVAEDGPATIGH